MAYKFQTNESRSFSSTTPPVTAAPLSLFAWTNKPAANWGDETIVAVDKVGGADLFQITQYLATVESYTIAGGGISSTNVSGIAQGDLCVTGVIASATSRIVFANTTKSATNTVSRTPSGIDRLAIGFRSYNGNGAYCNTRVAEVAIWNAALTDDEVASLAKGFRPCRVRPQNLVFYAPLIRDVIDARGGITLTASANAPTVDVHYRVY